MSGKYADATSLEPMMLQPFSLLRLNATLDICVEWYAYKGKAVLCRACQLNTSCRDLLAEGFLEDELPRVGTGTLCDIFRR